MGVGDGHGDEAFGAQFECCGRIVLQQPNLERLENTHLQKEHIKKKNKRLRGGREEGGGGREEGEVYNFLGCFDGDGSPAADAQVGTQIGIGC